MNRRIHIALVTGALLFGGAPLFAQETNKPMHSDKEVATQYKSEAAQLRAKAESHRALAKQYRTRTPPKGAGNYEAVAKHCDKLAQYYEDAAKEAEGVAVELTK